MKSSRILLCVTVIILSFCYNTGHCDVPQIINYQGRLTDSLGVPVPDGVYSMTFSIYNDPSTPTYLWQEVQPVEVISGLFNVYLGINVPFGDMPYISGPSLFLGVQVETEPEMEPRIFLSSSVFAMNAVLASEALIAYSLPENVVTDFNIADGSIDFMDINQNGAGEGQVMKWLGGNWTAADDEGGSGADNDWIISGSDMYAGVFGNIGIGTPTPSAKLDINFETTGSFKIGTPLASGPGVIMFAPNGHRRDIVAGNWGLSLGASASSGAVDQNRFVIRENGTIDIRGSNLADGDAILDVAYDSSNTSSLYAIRGYSNPQDGYGVGGVFQGGMTGVAGEVVPTGSGIYSGVYGRVLGGSGSNEGGTFEAWNGIANYGVYSKGRFGTWAYGLYAAADNADTCYGVYADAYGNDINYGIYAKAFGSGSCAGYFESTNMSTYDAVLRAYYAGTNTTYHMRAIEGICKPSDYIGTGGYFEGGAIGVDALVEPTDQWTYIGVRGHVDGGTGNNYAFSGIAEDGDDNIGIIAQGWNGSFAVGAYGSSMASDSGYGVYGTVVSAGEVAIGVYGESSVPATTSHAGYFVSEGLGTGGQVLKAEYKGTDYNDVIAVMGYSKPSDYYGIGGEFEGGYIGARCTVTGTGMNTYYGLVGRSYGTSTGTNIGVYGYAGNGSTNYAGQFIGDIDVTGSVLKSRGITKIDHPLYPENMYLSHATVESPEMKTVYDGTVILNSNGEAIVQLPDYFEALNKDFRYQLTCIGGYAPVYIAEEISNNEFMIAGGKPGMKVSWLITGIRNDAAANSNPIEVESYKSEKDRGSYINPEAFGLSYDYRIDPMKDDHQKVQSSDIENNPELYENPNPRLQRFLDEQKEKDSRQ